LRAAKQSKEEANQIRRFVSPKKGMFLLQAYYWFSIPVLPEMFPGLVQAFHPEKSRSSKKLRD